MTKVLIVDNDKNFSAQLAETLATYTETEITTYQANSAFQARSLMKTEFFDVLVIECFLSEVSGVSLCQEILEQQGKDCKIIFTSNRPVSDEYIFQSLRAAKASRFYPKPVDEIKIADFIVSQIIISPIEPNHFGQFVTTANPPRFELIDRIKKQGSLLGYELPLIIAQMLRVGEYNTIELFQNDELVLELKFNKGILSNIETPKNLQRDYLRVLVGDLNIDIDIEDLRKNTSIQTLETEKDLLQLYKLNKVTKHLYDQALQTEALNRLSQFVRAEELDVRFSKGPLLEANCWLEVKEVLAWVGEVVLREIPYEWLSSQIFFGDHLSVYWKDHFHYREEIGDFLKFYGGEKIFSMIHRGQVLSKICSDLDYDERLIRKSLYCLACVGAIWFDEVNVADEQNFYRENLLDSSIEIKESLYLSEEKQEQMRRQVIDLLVSNCFYKAKEVFYQNLASFVHHPMGVLVKNWIYLTTTEKISREKLNEIEREFESLRLDLKYEPAYYYAKAIFAYKNSLSGECAKLISISKTLARCSKSMVGSKFLRSEDLFRQTQRVLKNQFKSNSKKSESFLAKMSKALSWSTASPSP